MVRNGIVYFVTMDEKKLNAVDAVTGLKKWDFPLFENIFQARPSPMM
jgi:hypothetical protein